MVGLLGRLSSRTQQVVARHRSTKFLEGAMAAAALVALADGDASLEEGAEVGRLMHVFDLLRHHDQTRGVEFYLKCIDRIRREPDGSSWAREIVMKAANEDREAASLIIVICQSISEADGVVRQSELAEIRNLARLLSIDPDHASNNVIQNQQP